MHLPKLWEETLAAVMRDNTCHHKPSTEVINSLSIVGVWRQAVREKVYESTFAHKNVTIAQVVTKRAMMVNANALFLSFSPSFVNATTLDTLCGESYVSI